MFKTLITTCLLTFSCASGTLSQEKDLNVRKANSDLYAIKGYYCLFNDYSDPNRWLSFENDEDYTFFDYNSMSQGAFDVRYYSNGSYQSLMYLNVYMNRHNNTQFYRLTFSTGEEFEFDIDRNDDIDDFNIYARTTMLYFPETIYFDEDTYNIFTSIFTSEGNKYNSRYNGWYSLVPNNLSYSGEWEVVGNIIVDNSLYQGAYFDNKNAYAYIGNVNKQFVNNGVLQTSQLIYLNNVMLPSVEYSSMENTGVFDYVIQPVQYTFGDMIFSVIDAPVYMLSQLFSFELFGIQFYVAFMGVATVLLIFFIVRKVV